MGTYILSIVGIVFLGVLVDVVMSDGEMNQFVKGMFSLIALFVIVSPVQKIFNKEYDINEVFYNSKSIEIDEDFLEATNKQLKIAMENTLKSKIKEIGFDNVEVEILCKVSNYELIVEKVIVDISNMVINQNMQHINKYTEIIRTVRTYLNVEESDVIFNE